MGRLRKLFVWVVIIALVYFFYSPLKFYTLQLLKLNPTIWEFYLAVSGEIVSQSLLGLFYSTFFGALFFISIPVELIFIYYLSLDFPVWLIIVIIAVGNILGMLFNYVIGFLLGPHILRWWLKDRYDVWQERMHKMGGFILMVGNIFPSPIELVALLLGAYRYPFWKFMAYTFFAKVVKYVLLYIGYVYFSEELTALWAGVLLPWIIGSYNSYLAPLIGFF